ncbi:MAG: penicillin-binding protein, partial [Nocardioidaceae bacterium]|nr:penicillin-binding protein [Nocardioidaceae bacterium]
ITQQYVKILYLSSERTFKRKFKEAIVSLKLQKQQTKQEILAGYLNTIYFGRGAYGIQAAAEAYFKKPAKDLTVQEGAALAAVLNSPENLDPANNDGSGDKLMPRYQYVLSGMASMDTLDPAEAEQDAQALPTFPVIKATQTYAGQKGFMLEMVRNELRHLGFDDATINGGGLRVTTTFTKKDMAAVQKGVEDEKPPGLKGLHAAAVTLDVKTGAVRGIYGGQDYLKSPFNWAEKGAQPGSSFKPFALAAGIKAGFSLKDTFDGNSPYEFPDGSKVQNEGAGTGTDYGAKVNLIKATEESINTAFIDLTQAIPDGPKKIVEMAQSLGIPIDKTAIKPTAGVSLGTERVSMIDMTNAYATIANGGVEHPTYTVEKVVRASDNKTLFTAPHDTTDALDPDIAADVSYALQQVVQSGTGTNAKAIDRPAAGKTGTATAVDKTGYQYVSSAWFVGYTPQLATSVMYVRGDGNDRLDGWLPSYFGGDYPTRTWAAIMGAELEGIDTVDFPDPVYVDGDAPDDGHAPYTPPPPKPKPSKKPKPTATPTPVVTPTPIPVPDPLPTPTPTPEPTPPVPSPSGPGLRGGRQ